MMSWTFPDLDALDRFVLDNHGAIDLWVMALAALLVLVVAGEMVWRLKRRSPVEKLLRRRFG